MKAISQDEHKRINANEYPGTRQLCALCDQPTGRCEEDSIFLDPQYEFQGSLGPLCEECAEDIMFRP